MPDTTAHETDQAHARREAAKAQYAIAVWDQDDTTIRIRPDRYATRDEANAALLALSEEDDEEQAWSFEDRQHVGNTELLFCVVAV